MLKLPTESSSLRDFEQDQKFLDGLLLKKFLEIDSKGRFVSPPQDDEQLWLFIKLAFGIELPTTVVEEGHRTPMDFVADLFFERVGNALAFGSRHSGKTYSVAILNFLDMLYKPGVEIASAGAVKAQAARAYNYFMAFLALPWFNDFCEAYKGVTGRNFLVKDNREESIFDNGARQEIITATEKGMRSPHPQKARIDEIDLIEWEILQTGLSMASGKKKIKGQKYPPMATSQIRGQHVFTSTRQYENGSMQRLLDTAEEKGIVVYQWNIWEAVEKCPRRCVDDPEHGTCPLWEKTCKGKAHYSDGFFSITDFIDKARILDVASFEVEWENKRPQRGSLVYPMLDMASHILTPEKLYQLTGFYGVQSNWRIVSGIDFGISPGHPFVYLKFAQIPTGPWILFHEYAAEQRLMRDHAIAIKGSPLWARGEVIFTDWTGQERAELKEHGIKCRLAVKEVSPGINYIRGLLSGFPPKYSPQLYFMSHCTFSWKQMSGYKWAANGDKPIKDADDACFTEETEILTKDGWVSLRDISLDDTVMAVTETGSAQWEKPLDVIKKYYSGGVHRIVHPHLEFTATDNHRHGALTQYSWKRKKRYLLQKFSFDELSGTSFWPTRPTGIEFGPGFFEDPNEAWFAGFWLAEGCFDSNRPSFLIVDQKKVPQRMELESCLNRLGWNWISYETGHGMTRYVVSGQQERAARYREIFGSGAANKKLSVRDIDRFTEEECFGLFEGYMAGDGSETTSTVHYDSVSKALVDGVQYLCLKLGNTVRVIDEYACFKPRWQEFPGGRFCWTKQLYRGHVLQAGISHISKNDFSRFVVKDLPVFCVRTSTGYFQARTNGKMFVAGNCDAARYALYTLKKKGEGGYRVHQVSGL